MATRRASVKNKKVYAGLKRRGMSKARAARIANSPGASSRGGKKTSSRTTTRTKSLRGRKTTTSRSVSRTKTSRSSQGGTRAQKRRAGRKGGRATAARRASRSR